MREKENFPISPEVSSLIKSETEPSVGEEFDKFLVDTSSDFQLAADRLLKSGKEILAAARATMEATMESIDFDAMREAMGDEDEEDEPSKVIQSKKSTTILLKTNQIQKTMGGDPAFSMALLRGSYEAILQTELKPEGMSVEAWKKNLEEMKKNDPSQYFELLMKASQKVEAERGEDEVDRLLNTAMDNMKREGEEWEKKQKAAQKNQ